MSNLERVAERVEAYAVAIERDLADGFVGLAAEGAKNLRIYIETVKVATRDLRDAVGRGRK